MSSGPAAPPPLRFRRWCGGTRQGAAVRGIPRTGTAFGPSAYSRTPVLRGFCAARQWGIVAALLLFTAPCFAEPAQGRLPPEGIFRLAGAAYRTADYAAARDLYGKIVLEYPLTSFVRDSLFFLAECELVLDNSAEAEKRFRTLLSLYPDSPYREASTFRLADIAWRTKNVSQALLQLDALQKQFPDGAYRGNALCMAGDIYFMQKDYARALVEYDGAIARLKEDAGRQSALYSKGLTLLALGRIGDAQESFAGATAGPAADIAEKAGFRRAMLLAGAGNDREAVPALSAFLKRFPASRETEEATTLLASLLVKTGDAAGALVRWDALVKGFPGSDALPEYIYKRGEALLALDRLSAALDDFQAVVTRYPRSPWNAESSYAIGYAYARRAEYPRALLYFQSAAETPRSTAAQSPAAGELAERSLFSMGICLFNMGSFDRALARFEELRSRKPKGISEGVIVVLIGRTLYRLGRLDEAVLRLGEAGKLLEADSAVDRAHAIAEGADAAYWLGWANLRLWRLVEARDAFLDLAREYPADARCVESLLRAGICETMRADDIAAMRLFDEVLAVPRSAGSDETRAQALYEEARALGRLGKTQERAAVLERLAAEFPTGRLAAQAFYKLAEQALADGRYAEAESGFQRVARDFPESGLVLQALYWKAHAVWEAGDPRAALDGFWDCLAQGARAGLLTTATDALRSALRETGDLELARTFSARAAGSRGLAVEAAAGIRLEYAQMLLLSDAEGARTIIEEVRHIAPPEPLAGEVILLQGRYFAAVGDWRTAADVFTSLESARTDEIGARAAGEHARALESTGRTAEAIDAYAAVSSRFPDFPDIAAEALYNAGRVARARGDMGWASKIEESLRKAYPRSPWVQKLDETID
jgi:TolA-binding protein